GSSSKAASSDHPENPPWTLPSLTLPKTRRKNLGSLDGGASGAPTRSGTRRVDAGEFTDMAGRLLSTRAVAGLKSSADADPAIGSVVRASSSPAYWTVRLGQRRVCLGHLGV